MGSVSVGTTSSGNVGKGLELTLNIYEGDFVRRDVIGSDGKTTRAGTYASEVQKDDLVMIYTATNRTVQKAATSGSVILGKIKEKPVGRVPDVSNNGSTASWTINNCRQATVEIFPYIGVMARELLVSGSAEALPGTKVGLSAAANTLVYETSSTAYSTLMDVCTNTSTTYSAMVIS